MLQIWLEVLARDDLQEGAEALVKVNQAAADVNDKLCPSQLSRHQQTKHRINSVKRGAYGIAMLQKVHGMRETQSSHEKSYIRLWMARLM